MSRDPKPEFAIVSESLSQRIATAEWLSLSRMRLGPITADDKRDVFLPLMGVKLTSPDLSSELGISETNTKAQLPRLRVCKLSVPREAIWSPTQTNLRIWTAFPPFPRQATPIIECLWLRAVVGEDDPFYWEDT
jgi:hypothetical protein